METLICVRTLLYAFQIQNCSHYFFFFFFFFFVFYLFIYSFFFWVHFMCHIRMAQLNKSRHFQKEKSINQVPDTGTRVLDKGKPHFFCSSVVSFWITQARSRKRKHHISGQYWYTNMFQYSPILERSII